MSTLELQVGPPDGILSRMAEKTSKALRRMRILVEVPEGGRDIWNAAKAAAVRHEDRLGEFIFRAIHEKLLRDAPEMLPTHLRDKPRPKK